MKEPGLDRETARRAARLVGLDPGEEELTRLVRELDRLLAHLRAVRAVEEPGPSATGPEAEAIARAGEADGLRADEPDAEPLTLTLAELAPDVRSGFVVLPPPPVGAEPPETTADPP